MDPAWIPHGSRIRLATGPTHCANDPKCSSCAADVRDARNHTVDPIWSPIRRRLSGFGETAHEPPLALKLHLFLSYLPDYRTSNYLATYYLATHYLAT